MLIQVFREFLVKNAPNPEHLPYRMIDGAHRITKMVNQGKIKGKFYVLSYQELLGVINFKIK